MSLPEIVRKKKTLKVKVEIAVEKNEMPAEFIMKRVVRDNDNQYKLNWYQKMIGEINKKMLDKKKTAKGIEEIRRILQQSMNFKAMKSRSI